ncbi:hypothetical protein PHET_01502 [Paragonimus heterotremus]|uniref:C2H2-type domain-containing protein n=1 Tax=Paragonimus heterotremus TaxID=100268 RepID=A0A8J4WJ92_9TREM|nr:hypothetical protein PHET_01502 [Paragonimus heterotremus]
MDIDPSSSWLKEVEDYETRMFEYFSQCSVRLREWYEKGGEESEAYRLEYTRFSEECQHYLNYIKRLRGFISKSEPTAQNAFPSVKNSVTEITPPVVFQNSEPVTVLSGSQPSAYNTAAAAACYTQYYKEMIAYFDKLITSFEATNPNDESNPDVDGQPLLSEPQATNENQEETELDVTDLSNDHGGDVCCDPRAVMEQYFERFGDTGKWDWASWNNYLSWIARTNPQWYTIFLEYSQSLGIDWDQMYDRWKMSDPLTRQSFDDEFVGPVGVVSLQPPHLTQPVYHGLLFGDAFHLQQQQDDEPIEDQNGFFCRTCMLRFDTDRAFTLHLRGVSHIQRALEGLQRRNPEHLDKYPVQQHEDNGGARHYAWLQTQYMQKNKSEFVVPGSLYCELCQVHSSSYTSLQAHLNGRRHRENVSLFNSSGDPASLKDKQPGQGKATARLQTLLDVCTQPLIGLNYIVERQFGDDEECVYHCELCDERITRQDAIKHVCSVAHRTTYMKAHYPDMCGIIVQDCSSLSVRTKRIDFFARKIEDFEGRKRVKVKRLSAFDALRRIWRPLDESELKLPSYLSSKENKIFQASLRSSTQPKPAGSATKEFSNDRTVKPKPPKNEQKSSADDLEEGEITEDSSDEESTAGVNGPTIATTTEDGAQIIASDQTDVLQADDLSAKQPEEPVCLENFLPRSVSTFRPDTECEAFIQTLRAQGHLDMGKLIATDSEQQADSAPNDSLSILDDQLAREAEWVFDRIRARQAEEEVNRRQLATSVSAASKDQALMSSVQERRLRIQRGLDVVEETRRVMESGKVSEEQLVDESSNSGKENLMLPQLNSSVGPLPNQTIVDVDESSSQKLQPPVIESPGIGLLGPMDPNRQRLAVSNGAVEIILSALGALRDSGQLPNLLSPVLKSQPTTKPPSEDVHTSSVDQKVGLLGPVVPITTNASIVTKTVPLNTNPVLSLPEKPTVPSVRVNADPKAGLLDPQPPTIRPLMSNLIAPPPLRSTSVLPINKPGLLSNPAFDRVDMLTNNASVGLLGDPLPRRILIPNLPSVTTVSTATREPPRPSTTTAPAAAKKDSTHLSPKPSPQPPTKQSRLDAEPEAPAISTEAERMPSAKVASYMQADLGRPDRETMFDAYALFSRRFDEANRSKPPTQPSRDDRFRPSDRGRESFKKSYSRPSNCFGGGFRGRGSGGGGGTGRKLSVIADLLGVNEPPAPPSITSNASPETHSPVIWANTAKIAPPPTNTPTYWHQQTERSYLIPVSTFSMAHSSALPRISYYIPKIQPSLPIPAPSGTQKLDANLSPKTPSSASSVNFTPMGTFNPVGVGRPSTRLGPSMTLDEFAKRMQSA